MLNARNIAITLLLAVIVICTWFAQLDSSATKVIDTGLQRGLVTFASARALNAVISVAQGTEVAIEPMGVGVNLTPGQLLDPINDLVEQFSNLMLIACVALGTQKLLITVGGYWLVSLLLTLSIFYWSYFHFRSKQAPPLISKLIVMLVMIRFAIPLVTVGTDLLFQKFLANEYQLNQQAVNKAPEQLAEITPQGKLLPRAKDKGWWDKSTDSIKGFASRSSDTLNVKKQVQVLQVKAEKWATHIVNLIVIFLLQTLTIPVLLMWILFVMVKSFFEIRKIRL